VTWVPSQIGTFPIYVVVNGDHAIEEYSYDNNTASRNIIVELTVNPLDLVLEGDESLTMEGTTFNQVGNVIIRDNASLILDEATLKIVQETNNEFQMLLENNASLSLINSTLTSNANLRIYFFDQSEMFIDPSQVGSMITLELHDNTSITITESTVGADIVAASDSNATVTAFNSTLTRSWSGFGGNSVAYLTGISAPALVAKESAIIVHYQWLNAMVLDGTGAPLEGAYVEVDFYYNDTYYASGTSGDDGYVLFQCLCDRITSSGFQFFGTFRLNATYWYDGQRFDSDSYSSVSFEPYSPPVYRDDRAVTIKISDALPDLDPPFHVSDLTPARNEIVNLQANISNVGVVPAHYVLIRFQDDDTIIEDVTLERIDPDETINVYSNWTAVYPLGLHNISVTVDPYGVIPEPNETNNVNYTWVDVRGVPDLVITSDDITVEPSSPTVNSSTVVTVRVKNDGDVSATDVNVSLYEQPPVGPEAFVGKEVISQIYANTTGQTTITWTPSMPGNYTLIIIVDGDDLIEESNDDNNRVEKAVHVKNYADLVPADVQFSPASQVEAGNMLEVEVDIRNEGESTASNVVVRFWVGIPSTGTMFDEVVVPQILSSETNAAVGVWQANTSDYQKMETRLIYIQVNPDQIVKETDYSNDNTSATINVIDYRPDFLFIGPIQVMKGGQVVGNASAGDAVNVVTTLKNDGLNSALGVDVWLYSMDNDSYITTIARFTTDIGADGTVNINQTWVINGTMGVNDIVAWANHDMTIAERRYDINWISVEFNITPPEPIININLGGITNYEPDTQVFVRGTVINEISGQPLSGLTVTASLTTVSGVQIGDSTTTTTSSIGYYETPIYIPAGLETGDYLIKVQVDISGTAYYANAGIYVEPIYEAGSIPWWVWLVIIIVVAGVIIGFSLYLYKYGLGKMVECGECGALIPENSKKCPKCGVEFETGTAKCSECGAWIPASATTCPECGARFIGVTIGEEEDEYIKKMREQYESMLADQKELAKEDIGRKYSEAKFIAWWKKQPNYISFENWLTEEEERRKSGAFPCPVCGTLNPRGATICHKCGTIFETKTAEKEEPKRRPLRRIVRRSAGKAKSKDEAEEEPVGDSEEPKAAEKGPESSTKPEEENSDTKEAAEESQNDESDKGDAGEDDTEKGT